TSSINLTGEITMYRQHYLDALEVVLAWDLPEEALTNAMNHQVRFMSCIHTEDNWELNLEDYESFH
ncbi:MAG: hypothetical protein Q8K02_13695, partial [Flavobacterium sp.]|nr:hypothetical protein [Flavobacterium sp.]